MVEKLFKLLMLSSERFSANDGLANSAAIAYYAAFSLPSMILIAIALVGLVVEPKDVEGEIGRQVEIVAGEKAADQIETIVEAANEPEDSKLATISGILMLLVGATGVLVQLQAALNKIWSVKIDPDQNAWVSMLIKRILSMGMVLVMAFLLLITISARAVISELGSQLDVYLPPVLSTGMLAMLDQVASFVIFAILLAAMFRFLPDVKVPWKSVWFGAVVTASLFAVGKQLMGVYLSISQPGAVYGAAGSLAIILIWVYYSSMILLFGAQLTQTWTTEFGQQADPEEHAVADNPA